MSNIRQHGITGVYSPENITETLFIREDKELENVYSIQLKEGIYSLTDFTISYTDNTENVDKADTDILFSVTDTISEGQCSVSLARGKIYFHIDDDGSEVEVSYKGVGTVLTEDFLYNLDFIEVNSLDVDDNPIYNSIQKKIKRKVITFTGEVMKNLASNTTTQGFRLYFDKIGLSDGNKLKTIINITSNISTDESPEDEDDELITFYFDSIIEENVLNTLIITNLKTYFGDDRYYLWIRINNKISTLYDDDILIVKIDYLDD